MPERTSTLGMMMFSNPESPELMVLLTVKGKAMGRSLRRIEPPVPCEEPLPCFLHTIPSAAAVKRQGEEFAGHVAQYRQ